MHQTIQQGLFDSQTFKGSFLQQMEKLCRPLKFEKQPYNIYFENNESSDQQVLAFMKQKQQPCEFTWNYQRVIKDYVIDFQEQNICECECHQKKPKSQKHKVEYDYDYDGVKQFHQNVQIADKKNLFISQKITKKIQGDKHWTSLTLKEYKMKIKKKLQEKR